MGQSRRFAASSGPVMAITLVSNAKPGAWMPKQIIEPGGMLAPTRYKVESRTSGWRLACVMQRCTILAIGPSMPKDGTRISTD